MGLMTSLDSPPFGWNSAIAFLHLAPEFIIANGGRNNAPSLVRHLHTFLISLYESSFDKERKNPLGVAGGQMKE